MRSLWHYGHAVDFAIEEITPEQVDLIRDAAIDLHRHEIAVQAELGSAPARSDEDYWRHYRSRFAEWHADGSGFTFVARAGEAVLGFVFCVEREGLAAYETSERIGYVEEIAVVEAARDTGVGRALMEAARDRFRARGYSHYELSTVPGNDAARAFYTRLGLEPAAQLLIGEVRPG